MAITHAAVKNPGDVGTAAEWNAAHVISDESKSKRSRTLIVAANDSLDKTKADYVCDGTADQVEIQTAIDDLGATGGTVLLLEGTYNMANWIEPDNYVTIEGQGFATVLNSHNLDAVIFPQSKTMVVIKNLRITGTQSNAGDTVGVKFENCTSSKIVNVYFNAFHDYGFWIDRGSYNLILDSTSINADMIGIFIINTNRNIVSNCITWADDYGVTIDLCADRNIVSNCITSGGTKSILINNANCDRNLIHGNIAESGITDSGTNTLVVDNQS